MTPAFVFIASCLIGALIIELRARYAMRKLIHRRIAALGLDQNNRSTGRGGKRDGNHKHQNIHRAISFGQMKAQLRDSHT
jgi:hypothetical protein